MTAALEASGVTFINARMADRLGSLRVSGSTIAAIDQKPWRGDRIVDLQGDRLLPGLINAHDHLQLNSFPALRFDRYYRHVKEWIADINLRRQSDPEFEAHVAQAREARLMVGGLKNLLSGVTTVAHHDPLYPVLCEPDYPVGVVTNYGWSHSLYLDSDLAVRRAYRLTPEDWPWIIHAAEGVDEEAAAEFGRLERLGCIRPNTLLVHGVALSLEQRERLRRAGGALIWCPASNFQLFGKIADMGNLAASGRVILGTDSRLSGSRDLLAELKLAGRYGFDDAALESMVTDRSASLLRLEDRGVLKVAARADLLVLPTKARISNSMRADVRLVIVNGQAYYGDATCVLAYSPETAWSAVHVDGRPKLLAARLVERQRQLNAVEEGLELSERIGRAA